MWGNFGGNKETSNGSCPRMPLTDVVVRAATPQSRTRKLFDGRGLYLEVSPSGGRWWRWNGSVSICVQTA